MSEEVIVEEEKVLEKPSLFGMIMNPGVQFNRIKDNPKVIIALLVTTLLTIIGMVMMANGVDITADPAMAEIGEEGLAMLAIFTQIGTAIAGLFTPIIAIMIGTLIYFAISKFTQSDVGFKQLLSMSTYIYIISALSILVNGFAMMFIGSDNPELLFTSINSVIGAKGALGGILNSIEVFTIWSTIITALGLQIVAGFSKKLSWIIVILFYLIGVGFTVISSSMTALLGV